MADFDMQYPWSSMQLNQGDYRVADQAAATLAGTAGPSVAEQQLYQGTQGTQQQAMQQANTYTGMPEGVAARGGLVQANQMGITADQQAALLQAWEQQQALQQYNQATTAQDQLILQQHYAQRDFETRVQQAEMAAEASRYQALGGLAGAVIGGGLGAFGGPAGVALGLQIGTSAGMGGASLVTNW